MIPRRSIRQPILLVLFIVLSYWLFGYRPIATYPWSVVDDGLYLRHAYAFVQWLVGPSRLWLGDYDYFLLSKAPLYGVFLGILNLLCLPVRLGEYLILLGLPFFFARACRPVVRLSSWQFYLCGCLLMWMPFLPSETHLLRNALQSILTSYLLISCIGLLCRAYEAQGSQFRWAMGCGLLFSLCFLNREEASWLGLVLLTSVLLFYALAASRTPTQWKRLLAIAACVGAFACALPLLVSWLNYRSYGVFLTTYRKSDAFVAAYRRMVSLEPEHRKPYIPIRRSTRYRAYELSPTFAKLQPFLEGQSSYWVAGNEGHSQFNGYSPDDKEFFISNFEFALQYAAFCSGAATAPQADALFGAIDRELDAAIASGRIHAGRPGPATLAAVQAGDYTRIVTAWWQSLSGLLTLKRADLDWSAQSSGEPPQLERASLFVHSSVIGEPRDGMPYRSRHAVLWVINRVLRVCYTAALPALFLLLLCHYRRRQANHWQTMALSVVPILAVGLFCLAMAVVETLGFRFLATMGYNVLGYSPFSVLCAVTAVLGFRLLKPNAED